MLALLLALVAPPAPGVLPAVQQVDVTYLREFPPIEVVLGAVSGRGPLDTPARQGAAFVILKELLYQRAGGRRYTNQLTRSEQAMVARLDSGYAQAVGPILRRYDPAVFRQTPPLAQERVRFQELLLTHQQDEAFRQELLERFFSKPWRAELARMVEQQAALLAEAGRRQAAGDFRPVSLADLAGQAAAQRLGLLVVLGGGLLVLLLLGRSLRPLSLSFQGTPTLRVGGRRYIIYRAIGEVLDARKWSETHVSSSGGGTSMTPDGYVTARPVTVSSQVVTREEVFLREDDGTERALQLTDVDLPVRPGQRLAAVWLIRAGRERGHYVLFHNYNLRDTRLLEGPLRGVVGMSGWLVVPVAGYAGLVGTGYFPAFVAAVGFYVARSVVGRGRVSAARRELERWVVGAEVAAASPS